MSDQLQKLLKQVDEASSPPAMPSDLADRARQAASAAEQRTVWPRTIAAILVAGISLALYFGLRPGATTDGSGSTRSVAQNTKPTAAQLRAELAALEQEANMRLSLVSEMQRLSKQESQYAKLKHAKIPEPRNPAKFAQAQIDQAAFTLMKQADRLENDLGLPQAAENTYKRIVNLFPSSNWTVEACRRLQRLGSGCFRFEPSTSRRKV